MPTRRLATTMLSAATTATRTPRFARRAGTASGGVVLVLAMVLVILLVLVLYAFQRTVNTETSISQNRRMAVAATWAARGGITEGMANLEIANHREYDSLNERWAQESTPFSLGEAEVTVTVVDEARKFNLLALIDEESDIQEWAKEMLEALIRHARDEDNESLGSNEMAAAEIVENITKWLEDTSGGAGYLSFGDGPRLGSELDDDGDDVEITKTSPFPILTPSELMMVRGVTRELLYGPSRRELEQREPRDEPTFGSHDEEEEEQGRRPLLDYITCYGTDPRRININTAPREILLHLDEEMPERLVDAIIQARESEADEHEHEYDEFEDDELEDDDPYAFRREHLASASAFAEKLGDEVDEVEEELFTRIRRHLTVRSHYFTVISTANAHDPGARTQQAHMEGGGEGPVLGRMEQTWRAVVIMDRSGDGQPRARLLMVDKEFGH